MVSCVESLEDLPVCKLKGTHEHDRKVLLYLLHGEEFKARRGF